MIRFRGTTPRPIPYHGRMPRNPEFISGRIEPCEWALMAILVGCGICNQKQAYDVICNRIPREQNSDYEFAFQVCGVYRECMARCESSCHCVFETTQQIAEELARLVRGLSVTRFTFDVFDYIDHCCLRLAECYRKVFLECQKDSSAICKKNTSYDDIELTVGLVQSIEPDHVWIFPKSGVTRLGSVPPTEDRSFRVAILLFTLMSFWRCEAGLFPQLDWSLVVRACLTNWIILQNEQDLVANILRYVNREIRKIETAARPVALLPEPQKVLQLECSSEPECPADLELFLSILTDFDDNSQLKAVDLQQKYGFPKKRLQEEILNPALEAGIIERTQKSATHPRQSYRLTAKGEQYQRARQAAGDAKSSEEHLE